MTEKVARRGYYVMREYGIDPLSTVRVEDVMDRDVYTLPDKMKVAELSEWIGRHDPNVADRQGLPIVDERRRLVGIITRGDVLRALEQGPDETTTVLDAGSRDLIVAYPDEILNEAVTKMLRNDIGRLPVVGREDPHQLVGYIGRANLMLARSGSSTRSISAPADDYPLGVSIKNKGANGIDHLRLFVGDFP